MLEEADGAAKECEGQRSHDSNQHQKYELLLLHSLLRFKLVRMLRDESGQRVHMLLPESPQPISGRNESHLHQYDANPGNCLSERTHDMDVDEADDHSGTDAGVNCS